MKKICGIIGTLFILIILTTCSSQKLSNINEQELKVISELRDKINEHIRDQEKRSALLKIADEIEHETRSFYSFYQEHNKKLTRINNNYNATRQDFEVLVNEFNGAYENYLNTLIQKRTWMREFTSDDEWKKIMDRDYSFIPG
jgi:SMC interacting uncharacterized protein involved in chromosome segregation